jgi:hypothetical protein
VTAQNNLPLTSHFNHLFSDQEHANGDENAEEIDDNVPYHENGGYENSDGDWVEFQQQHQVVVNVTENRDDIQQIIKTLLKLFFNYFLIIPSPRPYVCIRLREAVYTSV